MSRQPQRQRTGVQISADYLDSLLFNTAERLEHYGARYGVKDFDEASKAVRAQRAKVRAKMHPKDREETA